LAITTSERVALVEEQFLYLLDELEVLARNIPDRESSDAHVRAVQRVRKQFLIKAEAPA
jgi:hypothetical protein